MKNDKLSGSAIPFDCGTMHPQVRAALEKAIQKAEASLKILHLFNMGGQSLLFLAELTGGKVLIKVPNYSLRPAEQYWIMEHGIAKEGAVLQQVTSRTIPKLIQADPEGKYIVRELVHGNPLSELSGKHELSRTETQRLLTQLTRCAIELFNAFHLSSQGCYTLRDFKPKNLIVDERNQSLRMIDVGSVRPESDMIRKSPSMSRLGTGKWLYWAPEQLLEDRATCSRKVDIFAFGSTFFYTLVGEPPFSNQETEHNKVLNSYRREHKEALAKLHKKGELLLLPQEIIRTIGACIHPIQSERPDQLPELLEKGLAW